MVGANAAIFGFRSYLIKAPVEAAVVATASDLGDLSQFKTIIADVQTIAATGDLSAAEKRITDFETGWDNPHSALRLLNKRMGQYRRRGLIRRHE